MCAQAMNAQFYKRNYMINISNTWIYKYMAHTTLGVKILAPKGYLMSILEGLAMQHKICKMSELLGSSCNSEIEIDRDG